MSIILWQALFLQSTKQNPGAWYLMHMFTLFLNLDFLDFSHWRGRIRHENLCCLVWSYKHLGYGDYLPFLIDCYYFWIDSIFGGHLYHIYCCGISVYVAPLLEDSISLSYFLIQAGTLVWYSRHSTCSMIFKQSSLLVTIWYCHRVQSSQGTKRISSLFGPKTPTKQLALLEFLVITGLIVVNMVYKVN